MAPIPLPLTLSNASTLLTWLCVYVPHDLLILLLILGTIFILILAFAALAGGVYLLRKCLSSLHEFSSKHLPLFSPLGRRRPEPHLQTGFRHYSCPVHSPPLRCPHCLAEITYPSSPTQGGTYQGLGSPPPLRGTPLRRSSDTTPVDRIPLTPTPFVHQPEARITTPPRREVSPAKDPVRRSPRPPKPRKLDD